MEVWNWNFQKISRKICNNTLYLSANKSHSFILKYFLLHAAVYSFLASGKGSTLSVRLMRSVSVCNGLHTMVVSALEMYHQEVAVFFYVHDFSVFRIWDLALSTVCLSVLKFYSSHQFSAIYCIHSFCSLPCARSTASSNTSSPQGENRRFLFQPPVSPL